MTEDFQPLLGLKTVGEYAIILCPRCNNPKNSFMHIDKTVTYTDIEGFHTEISYWCETKGHKGIIRFRFHEGDLYLEHKALHTKKQ